jgi:hypothetical protein
MEKKMMQKSALYRYSGDHSSVASFCCFSNFCRSLQCCASKKLDMLQR